jgi:outer membrane protein insertion porin family
MKSFFRLFGIWLLLGCAQAAWSQESGPKIDSVNITYVGPESISRQFILSNIRAKAGDIYRPNSTQDDIHSLYGTGQFYNIRVQAETADDGGVNLTFVVEARPIITAIKLEGNKKVSDSKLNKKITVKVGDPLDEVKLFEDVQEMKKLYEKYGYPDTQVKYLPPEVDEAAGRASVTFQIVESQKIEISQIEFVGASAFTQKLLRKQIKTSQHWMFSWITSGGVFRQEDFDDDQDTLTEFYRSRGYLDFEIKDVKLLYRSHGFLDFANQDNNQAHPNANDLTIQFYISEGRQYKIGAVTFSGTTLLDTNAVRFNYQPGPQPKDGPELSDWLARRDLNRNFTMKTGGTFTSDGMDKDMTAIEDFYGSKGYIDVAQGEGLRIVRIPNVNTGTMDLQFQIDEGQKYYVEKIDIRGNLKTKDKVIRRELAISPGEVFDMVRVKLSKQRLEGLGYFTPDKVDLEPEPTDPPITGRKDLVVNVEEQNTGNFTLGAGFSSVEQLTAFAEVTQGNFDLFHPPYFTGGGQKMRLFVQLGTVEQDYELEFTEPWFLNEKLALDVDLYRKQLNFESPNNLFDENRTGIRVGLTRALWSDFFIGGISDTIENVGITLNDSNTVPVPNAILSQVGNHVFNRIGASLAYDTRNSTQLPNHGQRTEFDPEFDVGDQTTYYKLALKSSWYFPGLFRGHVIEFDGRTGVAQSVGSGDVPFYDRYYLGGAYDLRGFQYRNISPREAISPEPIGGDTYWFGSVEYSIPIIEKETGPSLRFALFMDAGAVGARPYSFSGNFDDDWGLGFRLNIPHLGPLRLDYGIPITHDANNGSSGQFQFTVGYTRQF